MSEIFCFLCRSRSAHIQHVVLLENTCLLKHKFFVLNGGFVRISDHGEMGRESTWTIIFSRDAREMLQMKLNILTKLNEFR